MSAHDRGPGRGPDDEPLAGADLHEVEQSLRRALAADARAVSPGDRLDAILAASHADATRGSGSQRVTQTWLAVAAAAAVVAVLGGTLWLTGRPTSSTTVPLGTTTLGRTQPSTPSPSAASTTPSGSPTSTTPISTGGTAAAVLTRALPVYRLGPRTPGSSELRLFREFVAAKVQTPVTEGDLARTAIALALSPAPEGSGYLSAWHDVTVGAVTVRPTGITVALSRGLTGVDSATAKLAVQQLVWTAQAAVARGRLPVDFQLGIGTDVAPGLPAAASYTTPTGLDQFAEIATIWIDAPERDTSFPSGATVKVSGVASTFEATVGWQLLRNGTAAATGVTTASVAAPERGTYSFQLRTLGPGDYVLRVFEASAKDGSVVTEARTAFTVG